MHFMEVIQVGVREETGALVEKPVLSFMETMQGAIVEEDVAIMEKASRGRGLPETSYFMKAKQGVVREKAGAVVGDAMLSFMETAQGPMGEKDVTMVEKASRGTSLTSS